VECCAWQVSGAAPSGGAPGGCGRRGWPDGCRSPLPRLPAYAPAPPAPPASATPAPRYKAKKRAFTRYVKKYADGKKEIEADLAALKKHCSVIRVLAHTQVGPRAVSGALGSLDGPARCQHRQAAGGPRPWRATLPGPGWA
jgi:hypothetical protein